SGDVASPGSQLQPSKPEMESAGAKVRRKLGRAVESPGVGVPAGTAAAAGAAAPAASVSAPGAPGAPGAPPAPASPPASGPAFGAAASISTPCSRKWVTIRTTA